MMRRTLAVLILALVVSPAFAVKIFYGPGKALCLAATNDVSNSNWTITGAATVFDATNDAPDAACLWGSTTDGDTTKIVGPVSTTCAAILDVADNGGVLTGMNILYVTGSYVCKNGASGTGPSVTYYLRVGGVNYSLGTNSCSASSYNSEFTSLTRYYTNPATSLPWTAGDVDALQVEIDRSNASAKTANVTALQVIVSYEAPRNYGTPRERAGGGN